jgi:hypothetical protein
MQTQTDASGSYRIQVSSVHAAYDLSATAGDLGAWQLGIRLREGERRTLNLTLKAAISIEGKLQNPPAKTAVSLAPLSGSQWQSTPNFDYRRACPELVEG